MYLYQSGVAYRRSSFFCSPKKTKQKKGGRCNVSRKISIW